MKKATFPDKTTFKLPNTGTVFLQRCLHALNFAWKKSKKKIKSIFDRLSSFNNLQFDYVLNLLFYLYQFAEQEWQHKN